MGVGLGGIVVVVVVVGGVVVAVVDVDVAVPMMSGVRVGEGDEQAVQATQRSTTAPSPSNLSCGAAMGANTSPEVREPLSAHRWHTLAVRREI